jgi:hypothetical protein
MGAFQSFLGCIWVTKPDAYGWVGLFVGLAVAIWVAWRVPILGNYCINTAVGGGAAAVLGLLGIIMGELVRVLWTGSCAPT